MLYLNYYVLEKMPNNKSAIIRLFNVFILQGKLENKYKGFYELAESENNNPNF